MTPASRPLSNSIVENQPQKLITPLHLLLFVALSLAAIIWGSTYVTGSEVFQFKSYLALLALYGTASGLFVASRIRTGILPVFEIPVYVTCVAFLIFGLAPLRNFIDPMEMDYHLSGTGEDLVRALALCILGMLGFWAGSQVMWRKPAEAGSPNAAGQSGMRDRARRATLPVVLATYGLAIMVRYYALRTRGSSYYGAADRYTENLGTVQVLGYISQIGTLMLVAVCIERYRHQSNPVWKFLFPVMFCSELFWGGISGMKSPVLVNLLAVAVVSSFMQRKLNLRWLLATVLGLVLIYPFVNAWRALGGRKGEEVASLQQATRVERMAFQDAARNSEAAGGVGKLGFDKAVKRLDLLTMFANVLNLGPQASFVKGDMPWWMLPAYPFIPRLLWPSKPVLNEGARFTIALGGGRTSDLSKGITSMSPTYPGDLYLQFGFLGIPLGMFVLGLVAQWTTNSVRGRIEPQNLFVYTSAFLFGFSLENAVFDLWAILIKLLLIAYGLSWLMYGPRRRGPAA